MKPAFLPASSMLVAAVLCGGAILADDGIIAVKAGVLIDGTGAQPIRDAVITIDGDRIVRIGKSIPTGARVIDLSNRTVLPGFIDCHVHLVGRYIGEGKDWQNDIVRDLPQEDAIRGVRNARLTLEAGFTTVRMVGASNLGDIALRETIDDGVVPGPRILTAAWALGITGGHCDTNGFNPGVADRGPEQGIADGIDAILAAVRMQVKRGADVIKFCATGGVLSEGDAVGVQQYSYDEMKALVDAVHMTERRVAAHAHGTEGIKVALRAGVDSIEHGSRLDDEAIALFKETGAYLVPTLMAQEAVELQALDGTLEGLRAEKALFIAPKARASFALAAAAGVKIALGSDAGVFPHGTQGREFVLMVENGMSNRDAILAGTRTAAELLGLADEIGTIERGKIADLVAVEGNPLDDIGVLTRPVFVMHDGEVIVSE
jgi:imidazolonepropionase-like amidohydrolase